MHVAVDDDDDDFHHLKIVWSHKYKSHKVRYTKHYGLYGEFVVALLDYLTVLLIIQRSS